METIINFLQWLDTSNVAYLVMILLFLIMTGLYNGLHEENVRLRKMLRNAVKENGG
jgi:hypothetical protein